MMKTHRTKNAFWITLFAITAVSLALPFLFVNEPPLLDYPNHLARTYILSHLNDPAFRFSQYYRADWRPYPYILWDVLMIGLQKVMPIEATGKFLLVLIIVLAPVSVAWFLWQANRSEIKLSLLGCALSYYTIFLWGFVAFQLSLDLCFLMVGTWLWYRQKPSTPKAILFFALTCLTYFAHLLGFACAAFILAVYELTRFKERSWPQLAWFLAPPSLLALWARPGLMVRSDVEWIPFLQKLRLCRGVLIHGYNKDLDLIFLGGLVLCILVAIVGNRELRVNWRWLTVTSALFGMFLILPHSWGSNVDVDSRIVPFAFLVLLAAVHAGRRANWIVLLAVLLTAVRVFNITSGFQAEVKRNRAMNDGIEQIPRNARVFPWVDESIDKDYLDGYYWHYWAYAIVRRGAVVGGLFDVPGQTPMRIISAPLRINVEDNDVDWKYVSEHYDYVWRYGDDRAQSGINMVADNVFKEGSLTIYKLRNR